MSTPHDGIEHRYFTTPSGLKLHYAQSGDSESPQLILLNGFGLTTREWESQLRYFSQDFNVVALDRRGHGESEYVQPTNFEELVHDVEALVSHLNVSEVHLAGVSMGGTEAIAVALRGEVNVRSLILIDTFASVPPANQQDRIDALHESLASLGLRGYAKFLVEHIITAPESQLDWKTLEDRYFNLGERVLIEILTVLYRVDYEPQLSDLHQPTLVVVGDADARTSPEAVEALAMKVHGAEFTVIPHSGHFPHIDQPEQLNERLSQFFKSQL